MNLDKLSERQRKILRFIEAFSAERGYPPTIREIGKEVGISSTSVVSYNLKKLAREGFLDRQTEVSRGIRLSREYQVRYAAPEGVRHIPILGRITAGELLEVPPGDVAFADEADLIEVTRDMVDESDGVFALRVDGLSMVDAMVNDGDIVVLKRQETARDGELVAVLLKDRDETTLKKFYREGAKVRLQPANPYLEPIVVDAKNVQIQGRVLAVLRRL